MDLMNEVVTQLICWLIIGGWICVFDCDIQSKCVISVMALANSDPN